MTLIVALDPPANADHLEWASRIIRTTSWASSGFKIGLPLALKLGVEGLRRVLEAVPPQQLKIADLKLADIGPVMSASAGMLAEAGFDAIIAHSMVGYEGALDELSETCRDLGLKLILLLTMTHPGARDTMDRLVERALKIALRVEPWGVVAPATHPSLIRESRNLLGEEIVILSPGIGVQGALPGEALCAGADYEIVGRAITRSSNPREAANHIVELQREALSRCRT